MHRTAYMIVGFTFVLTLALVPEGIAQQQQHQEHHPVVPWQRRTNLP